MSVFFTPFSVADRPAAAAGAIRLDPAVVARLLRVAPRRVYPCAPEIARLNSY